MSSSTSPARLPTAPRARYTNAPATAELLASLASFDRALIGDYAYDATARIDMLDAKGNKIDEPVDRVRARRRSAHGRSCRAAMRRRRRSPRWPATTTRRPRRYDAAGDKDVTDVGTKGGRFLIGMPPVKQPFVFTVEHNEVPRANVTKEALNISGAARHHGRRDHPQSPGVQVVSGVDPAALRGARRDEAALHDDRRRGDRGDDRRRLLLRSDMAAPTGSGRTSTSTA